MPSPSSLSLVRRVEAVVHEVRGRPVLLDEDLAGLYGVETRALVQAVNRNPDRFPPDFMFRLSMAEAANLRSQSVISSSWGGRRHLPLAFTEQGVAMLSSVLRSDRAVRVNVEIMRTFVRLRRLLVSQAELAGKVEELERKCDGNFKVVFDALRRLIGPGRSSARRIGFHGDGASRS